MRTAVYAGTRNLYPDMIPAAKSLLINSDVERIYFLIEDPTFPEPLPDCIICKDVSDQMLFYPNGPNYRNRWTYMALMRAALTKIFPEEEKILSLDVDTIVDRDISDLWDIDLDQYYMAAVMEPGDSTPEKPYFNVGVAMFNLKLLRETGMDNRIIRNLNKSRFTFPEQDCINALCRRRILSLPSEYNASGFTEPCDNPRIIHFAGISNWNCARPIQKYRITPWSEIREGNLTGYTC